MKRRQSKRARRYAKERKPATRRFPPTDHPLITVAILARDEAANIVDCIRSAQRMAEDILVLDTGSADDTQELARAAGARVVEMPWPRSFAVCRNRLDELALGTYVLHWDADERLHPRTDIRETRRKLQNGSKLPDVLMVHNEVLDPSGDHTTYLQPRLIRRAAGLRWIHPVHEMLDTPGETAMVSNVRLVHHGYSDPQRLESKARRNLELALEMADDEPHARHTRMRCYLLLEEFHQVMDEARTLLQMDTLTPLLSDACAYGAAAAHRVGDDEAFEWFARHCPARSASTCDVAFLRLVRAARGYRDAVRASRAGGRVRYLYNRLFRCVDAVVGAFLEGLSRGAMAPTLNLSTDEP